MKTHNCTLNILTKAAQQLQKMKSFELETETPINKNISIASTSKLSSPPCKIYKKDSPESLSLTTYKQLSTPSSETRIGDSSRSLTGSVTSHKLPSSRKSFPSTTTKHTKREVSKLFLHKYPTYVTPPRSIPSSQALKNDSLRVKYSAIRNLFQPSKIFCSATGYTSPQSECIIKDSERSLEFDTPKQRPSSSPQLFRGEPSRNVTRLEVSQNLQSPRTSCIASTGSPHEIEVVERVCTKYLTHGTHPQSFPSSHIETGDSLRSLMGPMQVNLYQSNQKCSTEMLSDPSGCVRIPTAINIDQSPWIHSIETCTDSTGNVVIPVAIDLAQSPLLYNTETFTDSSGNLLNPAPVNLFQSSQINDTETFIDSSTNRMIPGAMNNFSQFPRYYKDEIIADSSGSVMNPIPLIFQTSHKNYPKSFSFSPVKVQNPASVNIFQSPYLYDATIKTSFPEIESEKYDSPKSSPKPVSPFKKSNKDSSKSVIDTTLSEISPKKKFTQMEGERSDNYPGLVKVNVIKSPKNSSPSYDSSIFFKFPGASRHSQSPLSPSSGDGISPRKKWIKKYHDEACHKDIQKSSSFKTFSKDSINSKELVKMNPSLSPLCSSISEEKLTLETESGERSSVNPETVDASHSPKNPNISDKKRSPETKERAKESCAVCLSFSTPKKGSPNMSKNKTPGKIKKQKRRSLSH
ncbi:hypothetical protein TNCV_3039871 [Trichonephila clavipes]|uniref:Uncharacterized protein n=1 Tax=Trichonephila clavipes TaxID=2585209 RepID=A0A8X6V973_TRICX|nr:hypothetical protein TNCV_3039871 [Trichonephila clavipes]